MRDGFRWAMVAGAAVALVLAAVGVAWAGGGNQKIHVIEHAKTDTVIDVGTHGDSTGDLLTFHNKVFDRRDRHSVGRDQGHCIRISPDAGTWECYWTTFLKHGSLEVAGPFSDKHDTDLAITGGTGDYRRARGEMHLHARHGGTEYDFVFHVSR
jgi:Dirigent-like protein